MKYKMCVRTLVILTCELFSCREKKDAEICSLEGERNRELEELKELEDANQKIRERFYG